MRPAAVRGSTEAVVRGSGGSSRDEADRSDAVDKGSSPNIRSDALSPSAVDEKLERALATTGSPRQQSKRSWSAEIDDVVEELVCMHLRDLPRNDPLSEIFSNLTWRTTAIQPSRR